MKELTKNDEHLIKAALAFREAILELQQVRFRDETPGYLIQKVETIRCNLLWKAETCLTDAESLMTQGARYAFIKWEDKH